MAGKIEVVPQSDGQFGLRVLDGSGAVVRRVGPYPTREAARNGVRLVVEQRRAGGAPVAETTPPAPRPDAVTESVRRALSSPAVIAALTARPPQRQAEVCAAPTTMAEQREHDRARFAERAADPTTGVGRWLAHARETGAAAEPFPVQRPAMVEAQATRDAVVAEAGRLTEAQRQERERATWRPGGALYELVVRPEWR